LVKYFQFKEGVDTKNAYILFSTLEDAEKALQANGKLFMEKHLRVDKANEKIVTQNIFASLAEQLGILNSHYFCCKYNSWTTQELHSLEIFLSVFLRNK